MRQKKHYTHFENAQGRLSQISSIDPSLQLGQGLSVTDYKSKIDAFRANLDDYNAKIASLDVDLTALSAQEKGLKDYSDRMLAGVGAVFGKNSPEYERAGGVRKDKKKRPTRKK